MLSLDNSRPEWAPLDTITLRGADSGTVRVLDGEGTEYVRLDAAGTVSFAVGGALGTHTVLHTDSQERLICSVGFRVNCATAIRDQGGRYQALLESLWWTMATNREMGHVKIDGKTYRYLVHWLRDHTHTLKGMKYFQGDIKSGFELYADFQRDDGMIYDLVENCAPHQDWHDYMFGPGSFSRHVGDGRVKFLRIPVENDVEFLYLECLYYTWKATGDTAWMTRYLDSAMRAVAYSTSDRYRWSTKYRLLKRGYTIDTWDFMSGTDSAVTGAGNVVDPDRTTFGVFYGDNTGMAAGCRYLAEMLVAAGRADESRRYAQLADEIQQRTDDVCWNGSFYRHHVSEEPTFKRELGVDESAQVSLSNAYSVNRGISHEKAVEILKAYQRIRAQMPPSSPGEWYNIYPPFEKGFGNKWMYMNAGVCTIPAGELARGAFEHGFEHYGADILNRLKVLADKHGGHLDVVFRGAMQDAPRRTFTPVDLREVANVDLHSVGADGVTGWLNEGRNDLSGMPVGRQEFVGIPCDVIDPASNGRRACLGLSSAAGYAATGSIRIGATAVSVYFLHTISAGSLAGWFDVRYADGEVRTVFVNAGHNIGGWFMPGEQSMRGLGHATVPASGFSDLQLAWRGANSQFDNVGVWLYGWNNPRPEVAIDRIDFTAARNGSKWFVLGVTLCDTPVHFPQSDLSFGIPDNWGAAAVVYALFEGLAGVQDTGVAFNRARVAPRWSAAGVGSAAVTIRYEASQGYVAYTCETTGEHVSAVVTSNADSTLLELLVPREREPGEMVIDGEVVSYEIRRVEQSCYACVVLSGRGVRKVRLSIR